MEIMVAVFSLVLGTVCGAWLDRLRRRGALRDCGAALEAERKAQRRLEGSSRRLEVKLAERTYELDDARVETLQLLAATVECRDAETFQHMARVGSIAAEIATRLGLRVEQVARLHQAAQLFDLGKVAMPDRILHKRGNLSPDEQLVVERHAAAGARVLARSSSPVLQMAAVISATHHEWWNGSGYPSGLAGERIPLVGRVVAVADVFDALTHRQPYRSAWPVGQALARIERGSGSQFDPRVVAAFLAAQESLLAQTLWARARSTSSENSRSSTVPGNGRGMPKVSSETSAGPSTKPRMST
jgi:response regulator RpfG family c-di-GMP phosphodiesterase